jgi:hypothetical protein
VARSVFCSQDAGIAGQGGCGHHGVCAGGTNSGKLCRSAVDCPGGGTCPGPTAAQQAAEGQVCLTLTGAPLAPAPYGNCPPAGHPKRVVSRAGAPPCPEALRRPGLGDFPGKTGRRALDLGARRPVA